MRDKQHIDMHVALQDQHHNGVYQLIIQYISQSLLVYYTFQEVGWVWMGMIMVYLVTITLEISLYNVNAQTVETQV